MTRRHRATQLVPLGPSHRRLWRTLWRRCSCGLPAPCVDRRLPTPPPPFPRRGDGAGARFLSGDDLALHASGLSDGGAPPAADTGFDLWRAWSSNAAARPALLLGRPSVPFAMWRDDR